ncbi:tyrosine-protein kinase family protein [Pseudomonas lopnurensis]|uniref:tyrosine-protein kinase family protein n=1 Tax=Pseudomonas lopnurensis TaxID=1477517 RepID=UPI00187AEE97|nr:ParA family protein [Pseudomonas lopnurensis]MBE7373010.1 ParA family protein [Pseudomonas lopnurensis]
MVTFDQALDKAVDAILHCYPGVQWRDIRVVRDMQGKLFIVLPDELAEHRAEIEQLNQLLIEYLQNYAGSANPAACLSDTLSGAELLEEPFIIYYRGDHAVRVIERRAMGENWLFEPGQTDLSHPPRFVFFSLKGGVGRSTALALWARKLCQEGKSVLVVDMDLEAPGLGAQLLERSGKPLYGVADWLVEDLVGNPAEMLVPDMAQQSPVVPAGLWVVPAFGSATDEAPQNMLAKLARAYLEKTDSKGLQLFAQRLQRMLQALEAHYQPDVVLVDSRAGLHETVATTLLHLDAEVLCFAVDLEVTWQGYRYLFSHLTQLAQQKLQQGDWRDRFKMVSARAMPDDFDRFLDCSYGLWTDTLYDESSEEVRGLSFDVRDEAAPHYPLIIPRVDIFEAFEPCRDLRRMHEAQISAVFGEFFAGLQSCLEASRDQD